MLSTTERGWSKIFYIVGIVYAVCTIFFFFPKWTVDDAYITFRYADNFATSGQLTWNVDEDPVEGYTGVLLPIVLAGAIRIGVSPETASHVIGVASYFLIAFFLFLIFKKIRVRPIVSSIILLFYLTFPFLFTNAWSGLETMLFAALITFSMFLAVVCFERKRRRAFFWLLPILLLTSLTRPEGVVFSIAMIGAALIHTYKFEKDIWKKRVWMTALFYVLPAAIYFIWRVDYYGQFLPNTFYIKSGGGFALNHIKDVTHFLVAFFGVPAIGAMMLFVLEPDALREKIKQKKIFTGIQHIVPVLTACFAFLGVLLVQFTMTKLKMNFSYRFFIPFVPILLVALGTVAHLGTHMLTQTKAQQPIRFRLILVLLILLGGYYALQATHRLKDEIKWAKEYRQLIETQHIPAAAFINQYIPKDEWLVMLYDAGAVPYFTGLQAIDMGGLNDEYIAGHDLTKEAMLDYFFSRNPGVAVLTSTDAETIVHSPVTEALVEYTRFRNDYTLVKRFDLPEGYPKEYYQVVFMRNDLIE